jgi:restriction system protein
MPIPGYEAMMLPIVQLASDGNVHRIVEATSLIADRFDISQGDLQQRLPSGATVLRNRVDWALTYLRRAGVLRKEGRGRFAITDRGRELLESSPTALDSKLLRRYPEFVAFAFTPRAHR